MDVQFLFNSSGEWIAFRQRQHVFDERSNWIGWLPWGNHEVATKEGDYWGTIVDGDRFYFFEDRPRLPTPPIRNVRSGRNARSHPLERRMWPLYRDHAIKALDQRAIEMFNEHELDGRRLMVNFARPREDRKGIGVTEVAPNMKQQASDERTTV